MRNLFVCHTQAQLILAAGLSIGRFRNDENILFLFVDFALKDELKIRINKIFNKVLYLQSIYPAEKNTFRSKLRWYAEDLRRIEPVMESPFNRVFEVCDMVYLEQRILKSACKRNPEVELNWLEDGITAYYQNIESHGGLDLNKFTRFLRCVIFKYLGGVGRYYDRDFPGMGGGKMLKTAYCLYPDAVREPYKSLKIIEEISDEEYRFGLQALYEGKSAAVEDAAIILVLDKLDTYVYPEKMKRILSDFLASAKRENRKVYCKFHPRESEVWDIFKTYPVFDKSIGIESLYLSLLNKRASLKIVGVKSTGLMSAKKLGYDVESLFLQCGETNENLEKFYSLIGVELI